MFHTNDLPFTFSAWHGSCFLFDMNITKERKKLELIFASTAENVEQANSEIRTLSRKSKTALMILHERKHGIILLEKIPRCAPEEMKNAVCERLGSLPPKWRKSLTLDNGQENRNHDAIRKELKLDTYFCNSYSSWEKGSVENSVGLTRRVWPKKSDYALLSDEEIATLEYRLNTRPRKRLGYLNPYEHAKSVAFTP